MPSASASFEPDPSAPPAARRFVRRVMATCPTELTDRAVLLVSELVTNAILHGAGRPQVTVELFDDGARISVADDDPSLPYRAPAGADATSGRGISIVEGIADEWGAEARGTGKRVWFEVRIASG